MAYEGRMVDLGGQICYAMALQRFAASPWWKKEPHVGMRRLCIPRNKACRWSLELGFLGQARLCSVLLCLLAVLPWREPNATKVKAPNSSFNKVQVRFISDSALSASVVRPLPLGFHGGRSRMRADTSQTYL
jgi:hypothetical protein